MSPDHIKLMTEATEKITSLHNLLLVTHSKPDGDAISSLISLQSMLMTAGIKAQPLVFDPIPERYDFLVNENPIPRLGQELQTEDLNTFDGVVVLDTCSYGQIAPISDWYRSTDITKIVVDHHMTRDAEADVFLIDEKAAATCLIIYEWAKEAHWPIDEKIATALYVGISTDTGWFRHSNTDQRVMRAAGELIELGVRPYELYEKLFQKESSARFRLRAAAVSRMELLSTDQLAMMMIPADTFVQCNATLADTEDLVNEPLRISSVIVSVMLVEHDDGMIRAGFRSKPPQNEQSPDIDVAAIAQHFGGGGHRRAAGARFNDPMQEVKEKIVQYIQSQLN